MAGDLTAHTTFESDYILLQLWLNQPDNGGWNPPTRARIDQASRAILDRQLADGGWNIYARRPLRCQRDDEGILGAEAGGHSAGVRRDGRRRASILTLGGLQAANSYTKINLSLFGLYPRRHVPSVPPEIVLLPGDVLYQMSSWSRAILVPLSIVQARARTRARRA